MRTPDDTSADPLADGLQFCAPGTEPPHELVLKNGFKQANRASAPAADEALHKAWNKASRQFDESKGTFAHFFVAILTTRLKTARRSQRRYENRFVPFPEGFDFPDEAAEIAMERLLAKLDRRALRKAVARGLRHLSKRDRKLLWLSLWKEQTYSEILERPEYRQAKLTVSACKSRASRAYSKLRPFLQKFWPWNN